MNWKKLAWIVMIPGLLMAIAGLVMPWLILLNYESAHGTVGIIGGADLPTYTFLLHGAMDGLPYRLLLWGMGLVLAATVCLITLLIKKSS